jgi:TonB family protein
MAPFIMMLAVAAATPVKPLGDPRQWITPDDYPPSALRIDAEGLVRVLMSIDAAGNLADCKVVQSSGNADLDGATCALLTRRAKFIPARDASGHPMASTAAENFRWAIPREPLASRGSRMTYSLNDKGHIIGCRSAEVGGHDPDLTCSPQGIEDMARMFLSNSPDHYRSIAVLLAMEVDEGTEVNALRSQNGEHKVVARSIFTISPAGIVTECLPVQTAQVAGRTMNMCAGPIKLGNKEFEPFPQAQPRKLTVSLEITAQPR